MRPTDPPAIAKAPRDVRVTHRVERLAERGEKQSTWHLDGALVTRFLHGDQIAFVEIVERHRPWIYRVCSKILGQERADDATQEVFTRVLRRLDTLRHGEKLAGWLKMIAVNYCRTVIEKERLYDPFGAEESYRSKDSNPEQQVIASERREFLAGLIDCLPRRQRLVFVMKYVDGYRYKQIIELTGFSHNQVKSYLESARRTVEKCWSKRERRR